jgi:hypothetical protein
VSGLSIQDVGHLVVYLAPGFFAQATYHAKFPTRDRPAGELIILSTVFSLPFVALAHKLAPNSDGDVTDLGYVCALILPAIAGGLLLTLLRTYDPVRLVLHSLGFQQQPEGSIWLRTIAYMAEDDWVTVDFNDGSKLAGVPRNYPGIDQDGVKELYLVHAYWLDEDGELGGEEQPGVIVRLEEVATVTLASDPTKQFADF